MWWVFIIVVLIAAISIYFISKHKNPNPNVVVVENFGWDVDGDGKIDVTKMSDLEDGRGAQIEWSETPTEETPTVTCNTSNIEINVNSIRCADNIASATFTKNPSNCEIPTSLSVSANGTTWTIEKNATTARSTCKEGAWTYLENQYLSTHKGFNLDPNNNWVKTTRAAPYPGTLDECKNMCQQNDKCYHIVRSNDDNSSNCWFTGNISTINIGTGINHYQPDTSYKGWCFGNGDDCKLPAPHICNTTSIETDLLNNISCDTSNNAKKTFTGFSNCTIENGLSIGEWILEKNDDGSNIIATKKDGCDANTDDFITLNNVKPNGKWSHLGSNIDLNYGLNELQNTKPTYNLRVKADKNLYIVNSKNVVQRNGDITYFKKDSTRTYQKIDQAIPSDSNLLLDLLPLNYLNDLNEVDCKSVCSVLEECRGIVHANTSNCQLIQKETNDIGQLNHSDDYHTYLKNGVEHTLPECSETNPSEWSNVQSLSNAKINDIECDDGSNATKTFTGFDPSCSIGDSSIGSGWELEKHSSNIIAKKQGGCNDVSHDFITVEGVLAQGNSYMVNNYNKRGDAPMNYLLNECNSNSNCTVALTGSIHWAEKEGNTAWMNNSSETLPTNLALESNMTTYINKTNANANANVFNQPINQAIPSDSNLLLDLTPLSENDCKSVCSVLEECRGIVHDNNSNCQLIQLNTSDIGQLNHNDNVNTYLKNDVQYKTFVPQIEYENISPSSYAEQQKFLYDYTKSYKYTKNRNFYYSYFSYKSVMDTDGEWTRANILYKHDNTFFLDENQKEPVQVIINSDYDMMTSTTQSTGGSPEEKMLEYLNKSHQNHGKEDNPYPIAYFEYDKKSNKYSYGLGTLRNLEKNTLTECKKECNEDFLCFGFTRGPYGNIRSCSLKTESGITHLQYSPIYSTYVKKPIN